MRSYVRVLGATAAVAAAMAMGSPAFATDHDNDQGVASESGDGGDGGESANALSCLINLPIISPNSDQECSPAADGGSSESEAEQADD